jgi:predicted nucleotidyltransferase
MDKINKNLGELKRLCKRYKVKSLFVFGPETSGNSNSNSDLDFIVDINSKNPLEYAENYFNLKENLKELFKRDIDLLEERAIRNPYLAEEINKTKKVVYG